MRSLLLALAVVVPTSLGLAEPVSAPRYRDVAADLGLAGIPATRLSVVDLDGDGFDDVLVQAKDAEDAANPGGAARVFVNTADPKAPLGRRFVEAVGAVPRYADGVEGTPPPKGVFCVAGDVDGDGVADLFRAVYQERADHPQSPDTKERSAILRGLGTRGAPRFEVVPGSGVGSDGPVTTSAAAFVDVDRDGHLDLFTGTWYVQYGQGLESHVDRLFHGDGKRGFVDVTEKAGLLTTPKPGTGTSSRPTYGVSHGDVDDDGFQDLLVAVYGRQWNRLWRNRGDGTFVDVGPASGFDGDDDRSGEYPEWIRSEPRLKDREDEPPFRSNGNTFSAVPADFDADGDLDVFLCEITHGWAGPSSDLSALLVNEGGAPGQPPRFRRVTKPFERARRDPKKWNQGDITAAWGDLDDDGRLDLVLGSTAYPDDQRLRVYRQSPEGDFQDVTAGLGIDAPDCGAVAVSDLDGDGSLEVIGAPQRATAEGKKAPVLAVYRTTPAPGSHRAEVELEATSGTNRFAFGARVWLTAGGRTQMRDVVSSTGHFGAAPSRTLHFGLGAAERVERVRVRWPSGPAALETFEGVPVDRRVVLRQGSGRAVPR